ncbi:MAG: PRTRC system ThiF family protein [Victivallales bacterium]
MKIKTESRLLSSRVNVTVAGCGGTGSQVLTLLARLHLALLANGHPHGLSVMAFDPDLVTEANIGRQLFYRGDIGKHKAEVLVKRINFAYGLYWYSRNSELGRDESDILIGCVDSIRSRRAIYGGSRCRYAIDCGNGADFGQVLLQAPRHARFEDMAPGLLNGEEAPDSGPSCSLAEALTKQEFLVNDFAARIAVQMIWELLRRGGIDYNAVYYNLTAMRMAKHYHTKGKGKNDE